jgi:hypothetical protein
MIITHPSRGTHVDPHHQAVAPRRDSYEPHPRGHLLLQLRRHDDPHADRDDVHDVGHHRLGWRHDDRDNYGLDNLDHGNDGERR